MIAIRPITPESWNSFRDTRLAALRDSPTAFGSTFARESLFSDDEWEKRAAQWTSATAAGFLAWDDQSPCGIVAGSADSVDAARAHLYSMWVSPTHRNRGVGRLLVNAVLDWTQTRGVAVVRLSVTSINHSAIAFYTRLGFEMTADTEPYPNDPAIFEHVMIRRQSPSP
jgi:ribosomal protein S18 acetylase RimI-like enzyme